MQGSVVRCGVVCARVMRQVRLEVLCGRVRASQAAHVLLQKCDPLAELNETNKSTHGNNCSSRPFHPFRSPIRTTTLLPYYHYLLLLLSLLHRTSRHDHLTSHHTHSHAIASSQLTPTFLPFSLPLPIPAPRSNMVCIECFVVPILFVIAAYFKQLIAFIHSHFFASEQSSSCPAPPPFSPSMFNLAAHGLPSATVDTTKLSASMDEEKEGPASIPQGVKDHTEVAGGDTIRRRK